MKNFIFLSVFSLLFIGCSTNKQNIKISHNYNLNFNLKQDAKILPIIKYEKQINKEPFLEKYFKVWNDFNPNISKQEAFWGISLYKNSKNKKYYSPNRRAYSDEFFTVIKENANIDKFNKVAKPAITIKNTFLRNLPVHEPLFKSFSNNNKNYPFDELANSTLAVNYPLYVSHFSKDKTFAFVANDAVWGWVDTRDIKILNNFEVDTFKNSNHITILDDKTPVKDLEDNFLFYGRVGTILMSDKKDKDYFYGKIFTKNGFKQYKIKHTSATTWPAKINDGNFKKIISTILGEPYGWGGYGYYRDCSLFTKDTMAAFGIWLPRNSKAQANSYLSFDLNNKTKKEKIKIIKEKGIPYFSILYMPGHIMLYTGVVNGKITITHNAWGIKTSSGKRALIAQAAITTLDIGKNQKNILDDDLIISKLTKLTILKN